MTDSTIIKKKNKGRTTDQQNTTHKTKDRSTRSPLKIRGAPEW